MIKYIIFNYILLATNRMDQLRNLRKEYSFQELLESDIPDEPMKLFKTWLDQATQVGEH
jgi:pyridoxine/pyridoxamine 5'-phosphate oxidase